MNVKEKFDRFVSNIPNQSVEVSDKSNIYQCMDLAYLWTFVCDIPKGTIQRTFAYEVYTKANSLTKEYFDVIPNTPTGIPQVGDLVVFDKTKSNIAGHIAIATGVGNTKTFESLDQNWGKPYSIIVTHDYVNPKVLGWLRPKLEDTRLMQETISKMDQKITELAKVNEALAEEKQGWSKIKDTVLSLFRSK